MPFEEGNELQKFFHVVIQLNHQNLNFTRTICWRHRLYLCLYLLTKILHDLYKASIQPKFSKVPYEGRGINENSSFRGQSE